MGHCCLFDGQFVWLRVGCNIIGCADIVIELPTKAQQRSLLSGSLKAPLLSCSGSWSAPNSLKTVTEHDGDGDRVARWQLLAHCAHLPWPLTDCSFGARLVSRQSTAARRLPWAFRALEAMRLLETVSTRRCHVEMIAVPQTGDASCATSLEGRRRDIYDLWEGQGPREASNNLEEDQDRPASWAPSLTLQAMTDSCDCS
jgi:hypothetical protein